MLSIIVPARNSPMLTETCLRSLLFSVSRLNLQAEFILVDDASDPDENILGVFRKHRGDAKGHECKIVRSRKHQHYSGVFSIGLHLATRDIILFVSNDMMPTPSFLQALLLVSALSPQFGIVRGTSNHVDSHAEHIIVPPQVPGSYREIDEFSRKIFAANACGFTEDDLLSGDAILLKRAVVDRIGCLDLRFFGFFGDVDYGMRAHLAGFKLVCAKGAWLYHEGSGHVKRQIEKTSGATWDEQHGRRMALVEAAYQEFRAKWHIDRPERYDYEARLDYFGHARANASRVELKYDLPASVMDDFEFH